MKKIVVLFVTVLLCSACVEQKNNDTNVSASVPSRITSDTFFEKYNDEYHLLEDAETGCKYLVVSQYQSGYGTGVTPLLKSDGTADCDK